MHQTLYKLPSPSRQFNNVQLCVSPTEIRRLIPNPRSEKLLLPLLIKKTPAVLTPTHYKGYANIPMLKQFHHSVHETRVYSEHMLPSSSPTNENTQSHWHRMSNAWKIKSKQYSESERKLLTKLNALQFNTTCNKGHLKCIIVIEVRTYLKATTKHIKIMMSLYNNIQMLK